MNLSTKGRYGLRAILEIAGKSNDGPISLNIIAQQQNISEAYLEQIMIHLKRAGLVKSVRGYKGGYILAKDPDQIRVGDIIRVLEGPISPVPCVSEGCPESCARAGECVAQELWMELRDSITKVIDAYTIKDLLDRQKALPSIK